MVIYICNFCKKQFKKKCNYEYHIENKKRSCKAMEKVIEQNFVNLDIKEVFYYDEILKKNILNTEHIEVKNQEINDKNINSCQYCDKAFTRNSSLNRHISENKWKKKKKYEELNTLKEKLEVIINNYQKLENENENLKKKINTIQINNDKELLNNDKNIKTINNTINDNKQINNGVILNNTLNIKIVQFGNEDINKLNLADGIKTYLRSTGGNIISNMIKYINLNEQYPENNNICITDLSREIVKIHNGKKFVFKKFKNIKEDIFNKLVENTRKLVEKYENDFNLKKTIDIKNKLKINETTLKLIDGISAEDIIRDEINQNETSDFENRDFTFEERLRIEHLDKKREGLQKKTFENIKDELYNAKKLLENLN